MPKADETMDFIHGRKIKANGPAGLEMARKAFATVRGRPRKGEQAQGSSARSLRLPDATWRDLEVEAQRRGITVHKLLRMFVASQLYTTSWAEALAETKAKPAKAHGKASKASDAA